MTTGQQSVPSDTRPSRIPAGPQPVGEQFKAAGYQVLLAVANPVVLGIAIGFAIAKLF